MRNQERLSLEGVILIASSYKIIKRSQKINEEETQLASIDFKTYTPTQDMDYGDYSSDEHPLSKEEVLKNQVKKDMEEERRTLWLSDAFETDTGAGEYEWTATMININSGKNESIMDSCHVLYEYAVFVAKIKRYRDSMELKEAIDLAVRECIEENILRDFLEQHRREVCDMCLTEFDEKKYEDVLREEGREEGMAKIPQRLSRMTWFD